VAYRVAQWMPKHNTDHPAVAAMQPLKASSPPAVRNIVHSVAAPVINLAPAMTVGDLIAGLPAAVETRGAHTTRFGAGRRSGYFIQLAAFRTEYDAGSLAKSLRRYGEDPKVTHHDLWWRVRLDGFPDRHSAQRLAKKLARRFHLKPTVQRGG